MEIALHRDLGTPLYRQIQCEVTEKIKSGQLGPGTKLPSVRDLAKRLDVSLITVVQAYDALAVDGLVQPIVGRGTFVVDREAAAHTTHANQNGHASNVEADGAEWQTSLPIYLRAPRVSAMQSMLRPARRRELISLASGAPDPTLFPIRALGRSWRRAMAIEDPRSLQYGTPQGDLDLRAWIAAYCADIGIEASADDVMVTSGSQQAIDLVARTFVGPGDYVLLESPTFLTALDVFEGRGARLLAIPMDANGARPEVVSALIERFKPRVLYTIPTAQNPTGATMSDDRRRRIAALARHHDLLVIEDDTCSEFTYEGEPPRSLKSYDAGGHVVFIKSFSKTLIPGLRVGCVVANGSLMARLVEAKSIVDRFTSPLIQRTLWRYLSAPQYWRNLQKAKDVYRQRRDVALNSLETFLPKGVSWTHPDAGFNLWINLPERISAIDAFDAGIAEGVVCGFGDLFLAHTPPPSGLRISFADRPEPVLVEGIRRLGRGISRIMEREPRRSDEREFVATI
jgi:2-aminoadipate transaminase